MGGKAADKFVFSCFDTSSVRCARGYFVLLTWYVLLLLLVFDRRLCNSQFSGIHSASRAELQCHTLPHRAASISVLFCNCVFDSIFETKSRLAIFPLPFFSFSFFFLAFFPIHPFVASKSFLTIMSFLLAHVLPSFRAVDAHSISVCNSSAALVTIGWRKNGSMEKVRTSTHKHCYRKPMCIRDSGMPKSKEEEVEDKKKIGVDINNKWFSTFRFISFGHSSSAFSFYL